MCGRYRRTTSEEELARLYHIPIPKQTDLPISSSVLVRDLVFSNFNSTELVAPWKVVDVNVDLAAKKIEVKVDCGSAEMWLDPQSGKRLHCCPL